MAACYLGHQEGRTGTTCTVCHKLSRERSKAKKRQDSPKAIDDATRVFALEDERDRLGKHDPRRVAIHLELMKIAALRKAAMAVQA